MKTRRSRYYGYRFPREIISHAVWLYHRFCLSFRDVEDLLAERCIIVTYETIRHWCQKFGPDYARKLKRRQGRLGDTWHLDELFLENQRRAAIPLAGCPSGRRRHRYPGAVTARSTCGRTILSKTIARAGQRTVSNHHRQAQKLWCCKTNDLAQRHS